MAKQDEDLETAAPAEPEPQTDSLTVDVTETDDDDDGPGQAAAPQGDRRGRRAGYRAIKEQLTERDTKIADLERSIAELRGRVLSAPAPQAREPQRQAEPEGPDEYDTISESQQLILHAMQNPKLSPAEIKDLSSRYNKLDRQKISIEARKHIPQQRQGRGPDPVIAAGTAAIEAAYPDVMGDDIKRDEAHLEQRKLIRAGKPNNLATAMEAAKRVSDRSSTRVPAPSDAERAKHAGTPGRAGATGGAGSWTPNKAQLKNALAYCDTDKRRNLDDSEKLRLWYHEVGKKAGVV